VDLATLDRNLAQLRETVAAMSANLVDLETDAGRTRLDQSPLAGETAQRWAEAAANLAFLWQWFSQLNDVVDQATKLRGGKARMETGPLTQLDGLINGPSIELSKTDVPLAQRGLFGPAESTMRCSPPELLGRMRAAFDQVVGVIAACSQKWAVADQALGPLQDQLAEVQRLAEQAGDQHQPELEQARWTLERFRQSVMSDPLGSDASVDGLSAALRSAGEHLRQVLQLRDNLAVQLSQARALLADLRAATAAAAQARAEALVKIAHPAVVEPPPVVDREQELDRVTALSAQGDWRAAANLLVQWTTRGRDALAAAQRALAANRAPLATRDELRGRLDAYRGKAYRLGLLEDPTVAGLYAQAQAMLFTAPTDLKQADQLVRRYQQALAGPAPREVAT